MSSQSNGDGAGELRRVGGPDQQVTPAPSHGKHSCLLLSAATCELDLS